MERNAGPSSIFSIVSPVYNEEDNIEAFIEEVREAFGKMGFPGSLEIVLVNDGSSDGSSALLDEIAARFPSEIKIVHFARNFGLETAVSAGLDYSSGDTVIVMDSDLQDDPVAFGPLLEKWKEGFDVVYVVRTSREESALRRLAFWAFYRTLRWMANTDLPLDASNFALMDRRIVDRLCSLPEHNRYLRGLRAWLGFKQTGIPIPRRARLSHDTRLGFRGQWRLAMDAVFSFSYAPLFAFRLIGIAAIGSSFLLIFYALFAKLIMGIDLQSWASLMVSISFFGGINMLGLGVLGEYVARMFDEVKGRPLYIVDRVTEIPKDDSSRSDQMDSSPIKASE